MCTGLALLGDCKRHARSSWCEYYCSSCVDIRAAGSRRTPRTIPPWSPPRAGRPEPVALRGRSRAERRPVVEPWAGNTDETVSVAPQRRSPRSSGVHWARAGREREGEGERKPPPPRTRRMRTDPFAADTAVRQKMFARPRARPRARARHLRQRARASTREEGSERRKEGEEEEARGSRARARTRGRRPEARRAAPFRGGRRAARNGGLICPPSWMDVSVLFS